LIDGISVARLLLWRTGRTSCPMKWHSKCDYDNYSVPECVWECV